MTTKIAEISSINNVLADNWLWNPDVISDVTIVLGTSSIVTRQTVQKEGFHHVAWATSTGKDDVFLEIREGVSSLLINTNLYRSQREHLALLGICFKHNLSFGEFED